MSYQVFENKNKCCGCTACQSICPKNAITMKADDEGFLYPFVNDDLCVKCGLCKKVCDFTKDHEKDGKTPKVYAVKAEDSIRKGSASGGMFAVLSEDVLARGGAVYGAAFDKNLRVCHTRATDKESRDMQRGSKYVQSDKRDSFKMVKSDLERGMPVVFSGTTCECAGLMSYLSGTDTSQLIVADVLCHGTPSPLIFEE